MENNLITVSVGEQRYKVEKGSTIERLKEQLYPDKKSIIVAAYVNNELKELTNSIEEDCDISFVDLSTQDGVRVYQRSLTFLLIKAFSDVFAGEMLQICHSVSKGLFFESSVKGLNERDVQKIEDRMEELIMKNLPFTKHTMSTEEAKQVFKEKNRMDKYGAIKHRKKPTVSFYTFDGMEDYFYGFMVPSSGYLTMFRLEYDHDGIVLISPSITHPNTLMEHDIPQKLFTIFSEYSNWINILGVENVGNLNNIVESGKVNEFIRISEALHEKKIARIADMVFNNKDKLKIILIAGPSSSGKTTFAQRLSIQLRVNGLFPVNISLDDYFINKDNTPLDENGKPDFEALEAIDLKLFNQQLNSLINGEEVSIPTYNFFTGKREYNDRMLQLKEGQVLVIEGIHGLNPRLTQEVNEDSKFKIYISAITSMRIDRHNRIPTTDLRFIRRIVRDHSFRGCSAKDTINLWSSVRRGEEKNIFPYQEQADVMFNSSLIYELGVLKSLAIPLLKEIGPNQTQYSESRRLIEFLSYFSDFKSDEIPPTSILREFIGGSSFLK